MAGSKTQASAALFLTLNLLFFAMSTCTTLPTCSIGASDLSVCLNVLAITVPTHPCCNLIHGLADLEASVCLCSAIKVLGINLTATVNLILNNCHKNVYPGYQCIA